MQEAYERTLRNGTPIYAPHQLQKIFTSSKVKLRKKEHAVPGLELADLLAYPCKRELIADRRGERPPEDFSAALLEKARSKMAGRIWLD